MSNTEKSKAQRNQKSAMGRRWVGVFATFLALAIACAIVYFAWKYQRENDPFQRPVTLDQRFEQRVRAASFLENVQYDRAIELYESLLREDPKDRSVLRNRAIASLANVKYHVDLAQDASNDVEKLRSMLPGLFDRSAQSIAEYIAVAPEDPIGYQLSVLRDIRWIAVLAAANPIIADEEQSRLFEKLQQYVEEFPNNTFLVTQFSNTAEAMSAVDAKALEKTVEPLKQAQRAHPRNLYLLCVLIQRLVQLKDPAALEYVEPLAELLAPFEWKWKMERRPRDLSDLRRALEVAKSDLEGAYGILIGWVGEAKSTEGSLVDAKSIDVSELAFLDLSDVQASLRTRANEEQQEELRSMDNAVITKVELGSDTSRSGGDSIQGVLFFDWNVDTKPEVLCWTKRLLQLGEVAPGGAWNELAQLAMPWEARGAVAVDLFAVDAHRGTPAPREVLKGDGVGQSDKVSTAESSQLIASMRHETIRDLLFYGDDGLALAIVGISQEAGASQESRPTLTWLEEAIGLEDLRGVTGVVPIDWESDGDLDLAIISNGKIALRENMGNRKFRDVGTLSLLPAPTRSVTALGVVDLDRDVDLDIVVTLNDGVGVLENIQHGQFRYRELFEQVVTPVLAGSHSLCVADVNGDYSWDLLGAGGRVGGQLVLTETEFGKTVQFKRVEELLQGASKVLVGDWDNDARIDAFAVSESGVTWLRNGGSGRFASVPLLSNDPRSPRTESQTETQGATESGSEDSDPKQPLLAIGDWQGDGWLDLLTVEDGTLTLVSPSPAPERGYLTYRIKGISDANGGGRNNQYAVGSTVEIYGPFGYQVRLIEDDSVHFGLANHSPYSLRTIFVNGLTQGVIDPKPNETLEEKQVLIGSCPFLYGWNGSRWELVTDLLWNAPLGLQTAKGHVLPDRRWEYLSLPRGLMQPHDGAYELRITEELWETAYFDHVALLAIDHPKETEWISNEKVGPGSIAQPLLWGFEETIDPVRVVDARGKDWTQEVIVQDGVFAQSFEKQYKQGLVEQSYLELDFGTIDTSKASQLILTGWIYPTDTSLNIAIDQNDDLEMPIPLSIWTPGGDGVFRQSIPFTGFPGGKPKTIVIPLANAFFSDDHRIRLVHSSQIYWDRIRLGYGKQLPIAQRDDPQKPSAMESHTSPGAVFPTKLHWLTMSSSALHYRGFSREMPRTRHDPHWYDYTTVSTGPAWPPLRGNYTRYGNVQELLAFNDDMLVVMSPGDEMVVRFELPREELPEGWVRDFVLHSVGWDKDAAMNTLEGQSSLPLPFSTMEQYPPGIVDRDEAARIDRIHRDTLTRQQDTSKFWRYRETGTARQ